MALNLGTLLVQLGLDVAGFEKNLTKATKDIQAQGEKMERVGSALTKAVSLPLAGIGTLATRAAIQFESAFAGVRKTINATEGQFKELERQIIEMSRRLPASTTEIAAVAEAAGQLGIKRENILAFSEAMLKLGTATNLSSTEAATSLARLANIMQMPQTQFDRLGSTIVELGNNLATTEAEIVSMGLRLAGAGKMIGLTEAQVLGFAGALSSVGIEAESGGTAFSRVMVEIKNQVASSGENLEKFAAVAGMSVDQFKTAFEQDAAGAIISFVEGLGRMQKQGQNVFPVLDALELGEIRVRDALLRASLAGDLFRSSIDLGSKAWQENTALTKEAEQRYNTMAAKLQIMRNELNIIAINIGSGLVPALQSAMRNLKPLLDTIQKASKSFSDMKPETQDAIIKLGLFAAALGPTIIGLTKFVTGIVGLIALGKTFSFALAAWRGGAATFGEAMVFLTKGPVALWVAAILAAIAVGYLLIKNWDKIRDFGLNVWGSLKAGALKFAADITSSYAKLIRFFNEAEAERAAAHARSLYAQEQAERNLINKREDAARRTRMFADMEVDGKKLVAEAEKKSAEEATKAAEAAQKAAQEKAEAEAANQAAMAATAADAEKFAKAQRLAIQTVEYQVDRLDAKWSTYQTTIGKAGSDTVANARQQEYLGERLKLLQNLLTEVSRQYADSKAKTGEYSEATMDLGAQLDRTNGEIAKTRAELFEVSSPVLEAKTNLTEAGKAVQMVKDKMAELSTQLETAKGKFEETSKQVKELQDANKDAQQTIGNALGAMRDRIKDVADEMKDLNDSTKEAQQGIQNSLGTMRDRIKDIADQMKDLQDANKTAQQTIGDALGAMRDRISEIADEMKEVRSSSKDAEQGMADAFASMKARAGEVKDQISDLQSKMKDVANVRLSGEGAMGQELQDLEKREALVRMAMNRLKLSGVESKDQRIVELQKQLDKIGLQKENVRLRIETEIEPLKDELKRLTDQSKEMSFEDAKAAITGYQKEIATLTTTHANMNTQIDSLQAQYGNLIPSIARTGQSFDEAVASLVAHRGELITNATKLANLSSRHDAMQKEYDDLIKVLGELVPKLGIAGLSFKDAKTVIDDNKKAIEGNNKELGELTTKQNDMQKEYDGLVATLGDVVPKIGIAGQTFDEAKTAVANHKTAIETNTAKLGELTIKHNDMKLEYDNLLTSLGDLIPKIGDANLGFTEAKTKIDEMSGVIKRNNDILDGPGGLLAALEQQRSTVWTLEYGMKIWGQELDTLTRKEREAASALDALRASAYAAAQATAPGSRSVDRVNVSGGGTIPIPQPFAKGGIVKRPTLGLLGERGTEVVTPLARIGEMLQPFIAKVGAYLAGARGAFGGREGQMAMASVAGGGVTVVNVRIGERQLEDIWVEMQTRSERRGRT